MLMVDPKVLEKKRVVINSLAMDIRSNSLTSVHTLLLIHGIGVSGRYYMPFARELAKTHRVAVMDLPGYGDTPKPKRVLSIQEQADLIAAFITEAGMHQPILVGHSMGCQVAARVAKDYPRLVAKLILLGPTVNKWERSLFMQGVRLLQDTLREPFKVNSIVVHDYLQMGISRYLKTSRYMIADHLEDSLRDCHLPILMIRGEFDKIAARRWVEYLSEQMEDGTVKELAGAPHVVQYSEARRLKRLCHTFIKS
jgi:pimeloyl-ACP methyl ester carboxylesterase